MVRCLSLLMCPLTKKMIKDPVLAADGHTYERAAIERFFAQSPSGEELRSPVTGQVLEHSSLSSNAANLEVIRQVCFGS